MGDVTDVATGIRIRLPVCFLFSGGWIISQESALYLVSDGPLEFTNIYIRLLGRGDLRLGCQS